MQLINTNNVVKKVYADGINKDEKIYKDGRIIARDADTGEVIFVQHNKVIIDGSDFAAAKYFNITPSIKAPSYNTVLGLENTDTTAFGSPGVRREDIVCLFCVGTDGCGPLAHQIYDVDYKKWIGPEAIIPIRYPLAAADITSAQRDIYFGRKVVDKYVAYYFKRFSQEPQYIKRYLDGTMVGADIHTNPKETAAEAFVEINFKITKEDCREFFLATTGINDAKVNTFSLCTAWAKSVGNYTYYQDIRPLTKFNISSEPLIDRSKGIDFTYQIFL